MAAAWLAWTLSLGASSLWLWVPLVASGLALLLAWSRTAGGVALAMTAVLFVVAILTSATVGWFLLPAVGLLRPLPGISPCDGASPWPPPLDAAGAHGHRVYSAASASVGVAVAARRPGSTDARAAAATHTRTRPPV